MDMLRAIAMFPDEEKASPRNIASARFPPRPSMALERLFATARPCLASSPSHFRLPSPARRSGGAQHPRGLKSRSAFASKSDSLTCYAAWAMECSLRCPLRAEGTAGFFKLFFTHRRPVRFSDKNLHWAFSRKNSAGRGLIYFASGKNYSFCVTACEPTTGRRTGMWEGESDMSRDGLA